MSAVKRTGMTLGVKRRTETPAIPDDVVESFAAGAETERQKGATPKKKPTTNLSPSTESCLVVRDSFTMPEYDYALIAETQQRCLRKGLPMTKGEVLRAGLRALEAMSDTALHGLAGKVEKIKTGRPKR